MILKLGTEHLGHKLYKVYIADDPGLTYAHISVSGERLQDHWSSGFVIFHELFIVNRN